MDWSFAVNTGLALLAVAACAWGVAILRGSERWFRLLAGGGDFLALDPDAETFRVAARQSGAVVCLLSVVLALVCAWQFAQLFGAPESAVEALGGACMLAGAVFGIVAVVVIVLQMKTHARLLHSQK